MPRVEERLIPGSRSARMPSPDLQEISEKTITLHGSTARPAAPPSQWVISHVLGVALRPGDPPGPPAGPHLRLEFDRIAHRDLARCHGRAVDAEPGVAVARYGAQDRRVPGQRHRVHGDHHAPLVALVHPYPQPADAQYPADPGVLGEVAPAGIHQEVGPEPPGREVRAGQAAEAGYGLRG